MLDTALQSMYCPLRGTEPEAASYLFCWVYTKAQETIQSVQERHTRKPTKMPLRCPIKEALGMMMDVKTREANGVRYMGMFPNPKTLKLALPLTARTVIHLATKAQPAQHVTLCFFKLTLHA